ncbi:MAG: YhcH/YjgK/YiaL family protein [Tannerella sp.]|jgi:YhcH/YjgK/YiaL family protein|nr:YhcH/YjgK/YiaL family protein [Tannerella sp.]
MIIDSLENSGKYESLHPLFKKAFQYIKETDFTGKKDGKIRTDDTHLYFEISRFRGKDPADATLESHKKCIDIHAPIVGVERIGWKAADSLMIISEAYNNSKDIMFYHDYPTTYIKLYPGQFAIFFPNEGHAPSIGEGDIRKILAKIATNG